MLLKSNKFFYVLTFQKQCLIIFVITWEYPSWLILRSGNINPSQNYLSKFDGAAVEYFFMNEFVLKKDNLKRKTVMGWRFSFQARSVFYVAQMLKYTIRYCFRDYHIMSQIKTKKIIVLCYS